MHHSAAIVTMLLIAAAAPAAAQDLQRPTLRIQDGTVRVQDGAQVLIVSESDARETRDQLQQLLRQLPPSVGDVLRRDASLLTLPGYLEPYPTLSAFLEQHPEIARNPSFFLGGFEYYERPPVNRSEQLFAVVLGGFAGAIALTAVLAVFVWLVRAIIEHRRWLRLSRVQAEVHTKVMDRLTSNEDLLAYIQTPAGRRFLESAPIAVDGAPRQSAPVTSILWSLQGGVVLLALGVGLWFLHTQGNVMMEVAQALYVVGVIAGALGAGFVASSLMAYMISSRLGLLAPSKVENA